MSAWSKIAARLARAWLLLAATATASCNQITPTTTSAQTFDAPASGPFSYRVPANTGDGWETASLESVGMDAAPLLDLARQVRDRQLANIHSVLVVRRNKLVFEEYFSGMDETDAGLQRITFDPETKHDLRSITKSVTSLLLGIAADHGAIRDLERPVLDYLPQYAKLRDAEHSRVLLKHVLTMTAGLEWDETVPYGDPRNGERQMNKAADPFLFVLTRPVVTAPGTTFKYNGGATMLLAGVIQHVTGMPVDAYAERMLFAPLGITDYEWRRHANGTPRTASGLRLRPRDLAKIGSLYLNGGRWGEHRIISAAWTNKSMRSHATANANYRYGYQWWIGTSTIRKTTINWAAAAGNGGQRLFVFPSLALLVLCTAGEYDDFAKEDTFNYLADKYVLPAVRELP